MDAHQGKGQTPSPAAEVSASQVPAAQSPSLDVPRQSQDLTPGQMSHTKDVLTTTPETRDTVGVERPHLTSNANGSNSTGRSVDADNDPLLLRQHIRENVNKKSLKEEYPKGNSRDLKKFYVGQNELIDQYLNSSDEERLQALDDETNGPKVKFAVNASFVVNLCLFVIQFYAAISTGSLALFATAADAFMDLVSSFVMLITSRMANRPSYYKYPVGRARIESIGIVLFSMLMTTVAIQLIIESGRRLGQGRHESEPLQIIPIAFVAVAIFSKFCLFVYCFHYRRYPSAHVFFIDHRNDLVVNTFGLVMSIVGNRVVWYLDPIGALCIGLLILFSWASNAFDQVWLLIGKAAPNEFISKVIYLAVTHDDAILQVETCRAYHSGQRFWVEVDVIMDKDAPLQLTHDVAQDLQRKLEGLSDVERAFVHVDYEDEHDIKEEHKPLYGAPKQRRTLKQAVASCKSKLTNLARRSNTETA